MLFQTFHVKESICHQVSLAQHGRPHHGLRTPNEGINQKYLKNWADVADKISFGRK